MNKHYFSKPKITMAAEKLELFLSFQAENYADYY